MIQEIDSMRVLIVDDAPLSRTLLRTLLKSDGAPSVSEAGDGQAMLLMVETHPPDLIFLDVHLPDANGLDLLSRLKQRFPHIAVAMISANDSAAKMREAVRRGAVGYIPKPLSEPMAMRAVRDILRCRALEASRVN